MASVITLCLSFFITAHAPLHVSESHYAHVTPFDAANATMILNVNKNMGQYFSKLVMLKKLIHSLVDRVIIFFLSPR